MKKVRYKVRKRRTWRKLHIGVDSPLGEVSPRADEATGEILVSALTRALRYISTKAGFMGFSLLSLKNF